MGLVASPPYTTPSSNWEAQALTCPPWGVISITPRARFMFFLVLPDLWPNHQILSQLWSHPKKKIHNVLAMPKTQKTCIVGTTPPMKSNPMACGLGWGHGHIVQWQCFACCMTCGMPMGACCGSHFGPNGGGQTPNFNGNIATQIFLAANMHISAP